MSSFTDKMESSQPDISVITDQGRSKYSMKERFIFLIGKGAAVGIILHRGIFPGSGLLPSEITKERTGSFFCDNVLLRFRSPGFLKG